EQGCNKEFNTSGKHLLTALAPNERKSGFYLLDFAKGESPLVYEDAEISNLIVSDGGNAIAFKEQTFDESPSIRVMSLSKPAAIITAVESNPHQKQFTWGSSKLIHYEDSHKNKLNGALFYPAGYEAGKKYPMIVYIYEKETYALHQYVNPTLENNNGFNVTNLTHQGYFVLMPDIEYREGDTGVSALDCITAAVRSVLAMGCVNPAKVGLFGHSFGGYEVNFIVTQTKMFAAAASGSASADIVSNYLEYKNHFECLDLWHFENQQYRMGKSFYDDQEAYHRNSPIEHASNITTPLLSWVGSKDNSVNPAQLMELYIALRRLKRKNIMLVYRDDGHVFSKTENQVDFTCRLEEWFDYYLKDGPIKPWMVAESSGLASEQISDHPISPNDRMK
ncbi:MAG: S9 family peptidase, partial [Sphingobacteriales bacterium]